MIKLTNEGYVFVSKKGIMYDLLEGMGIGTNTKYTSDLIFIFLYDSEINVNERFVDYLFGASLLESHLEEYEKEIGRIVDEYEKKNFNE